MRFDGLARDQIGGDLVVGAAADDGRNEIALPWCQRRWTTASRLGLGFSPLVCFRPAENTWSAIAPVGRYCKCPQAGTTEVSMVSATKTLGVLLELHMPPISNEEAEATRRWWLERGIENALRELIDEDDGVRLSPEGDETLDEIEDAVRRVAEQTNRNVIVVRTEDGVGVLLKTPRRAARMAASNPQR